VHRVSMMLLLEQCGMLYVLLLLLLERCCALWVAQHCALCVYVGGTAWRVVVVGGVCVGGAVCCL
jgi:hypothetical protein